MTEDFKHHEIDNEGEHTLKVIASAKNFNKWMFRTISRHCSGRTLEIGSGIGNISDFFLRENCEIVMSDIRPSYCDYLERKYEGCGSTIFRNLDLADPELFKKFGQHFETFDVVFALNVIEHIKDDALAITNCTRFLKRGGSLLILVPAYKSLFNIFDRELGHYKRYTKKSMMNIFLNAGLKIKHTQYFNVAGIPGWWFSGKLQRNKTIPASQVKLFNALVPLFKLVDKIFLNRIGLSVIVVGEKH